MNVKDRFNEMMEKIESEVNKKFPKRTKNIAEDIQLHYGYMPREINAVFKYLTDLTLPEYIRERRLMAAYNELISGKDWDKSREAAISISEANDQPTFNKKIKETFGMTPKEAFEKKDASKIKPVSTWDYISSNEIENEIDKAKQDTPKPTKFGVNLDAYKKALEAAEYQSFYEMSDEDSEIAFSISEKLSIPVKLAFDFVFECGNCDIKTDYTVDELLSVDRLYAYIILFKGELGIDHLQEFLRVSYNYKFDFRTLDIDSEDLIDFDYLYEAFNRESVFDIIRLADNYNHLKQDATEYVKFEEFLYNVFLGMTPDDAIEPMPMYEEHDLTELMDAIYSTEEAHEAELEEWKHSDMNIYDNYDIDNPYYSTEEQDDSSEWFGFHREEYND